MREEKKGKEGKGRKGKGKEGKEGGTAAAPPAPSRQLLPQLAAPRLWQAGSMAAVESRVCETAGCSSEAKLQCPTCLKLGIQGSYFCSQVRALPLLPPAAGGCGGGGVGACVHGVGGDPCAGGCPGLAAAAAPGLVPLRERGGSVPPRPMEGPFGGPPFGFFGARRGETRRAAPCASAAAAARTCCSAQQLCGVLWRGEGSLGTRFGALLFFICL